MVTVTVSGYSVTERFKFRRDSECVTASGSPRLGGHDSDVQAAAARTLSLSGPAVTAGQTTHFCEVTGLGYGPLARRRTRRRRGPREA